MEPKPTSLADLPLRERKQARTRIALVHAALARLQGELTLDDISVKDLCADAGISEASFFNYFPKKSDVLVYFVQLWSLELAWRVRHELAGVSAREAIEEIFAVTGRDVRDRPAVMGEIVAQQARWTRSPTLTAVPLAERLAAFPDRRGIADVPAIGLGGLLPPLIDRAVTQGELPATVDKRAALLALSAIFFGVPVALRAIDPALVERAYLQQIDVVWRGLQQPSPDPARPRRRTARKARSR